MTTIETRNPVSATFPTSQVAGASALVEPEAAITRLVAEVYEAAAPAERGLLLERLLRPLGVLSLVAIADGVFARIRFRSGWPEMHVRLDDIAGVRASQVATLVEHVQQVSVEAVDGLAQLLAASPVWSGSAAAAVLVGLLLRRRAHRGAPRRVESEGIAALAR